MVRSSNYNTKQGEAILTYLSSLGGAHTTAEQIAAYFEGSQTPVGATTIYRHLDRLTQSGKVRKLIVDGISSACYRYVDGPESESFQLKCDCCGKLCSLDCNTVGEFEKHVLKFHEFRIDPVKTVFYGRCKDCRSVE
ncbi:MAG: transcriptional repressor [Bacillota bacterium]